MICHLLRLIFFFLFFLFSRLFYNHKKHQNDWWSLFPRDDCQLCGYDRHKFCYLFFLYTLQANRNEKQWDETIQLNEPAKNVTLESHQYISSSLTEQKRWQNNGNFLVAVAAERYLNRSNVLMRAILTITIVQTIFYGMKNFFLFFFILNIIFLATVYDTIWSSNNFYIIE